MGTIKCTFKCKLVEFQDGQYKNYVFLNLEETTDIFMKYITATQVPNWNQQEIKIGDTGYLECEYVKPGDTYLRKDKDIPERYNYSACYLLKFIKDTPKVDIKEFKF